MLSYKEEYLVIVVIALDCRIMLTSIMESFDCARTLLGFFPIDSTKIFFNNQGVTLLLSFLIHCAFIARFILFDLSKNNSVPIFCSIRTALLRPPLRYSCRSIIRCFFYFVQCNLCLRPQESPCNDSNFSVLHSLSFNPAVPCTWCILLRGCSVS